MISYSIFRAAVLVLLLSLGGATQILAQAARPAPSSSDDRATTLPQTQKTASQTAAVPVTGAQQNTPPTNTQPRQPIVPLSARQKLVFGARKAFLDPTAYFGPAVDAYFTERRDVKAPSKTAGDKFADGASRYARSFTTNTTAALLGSGVYPALFKQDPRYHVSGKHGFMPRALYAASRTVITLGDNGQTQINFSGLGGNLTSAGLANIYERDLVKARDANGRPLSFRRRVGVGPTFANFGITTAMDAATNIAFKEFDVVGRLLKRLHKR
jgi:hypothetical protein